MNGGCAHDQSAIGGGGGPSDGVDIPRTQPRIGGGVASGQGGALPGHGSQGSSLASRHGLAGGERGGCIGCGPGGGGGATKRARECPPLLLLADEDSHRELLLLGELGWHVVGPATVGGLEVLVDNIVHHVIRVIADHPTIVDLAKDLASDTRRRRRRRGG
jgi:hypothetical protein